MEFKERIEAGPGNAMFSAVWIKGTKVHVKSILMMLSEGKQPSEILEVHQELKIEDIYACLNYAANLVGAIDFEKSMRAIDKYLKRVQAVNDLFDDARQK